METFDARLRSFSKPKGKSSAKWPHPDTFVANPTSLAEAGFFFKPSKDDPDNVQCFICKKELGGWDEDDNPFDVHVKKCPKCPWAIARCSLEFDVDSDGQFSITGNSRFPTNKALEKARADTFGGKKWWPHDTVKNHSATSKKMAKAGFVYTPQVQGDDTATCFYCNLSLSGWDAEDNPTEEHIKRVERSGKPCPFFESTERPKSQASTRSTKSNPRKSRARTEVGVASDEEDEPITIKAPTKRGRPKKHEPEKPKKPSSTISDVEESEDLEEDDDPSLKVQPVPAPRKSSRKPASKAKPASRSTGRGRQRAPTPSEDGDDIASEAHKKPARSRTKSGKSRAKSQEKEEAEDKGKESDKPPSDADGRVTKSYQDFTVDINAVEEAKGRGRKMDGRKSRSASRGRARSKSRARSTNASSLIDPKSKPLLRASSRSRTSGITEIEEMETERMLAVTPSESEAEPQPETEKELKTKPPSKGRRQTRPQKEQMQPDLDDARQETPRPAPSSATVAADESMGEKGKVQSKPTPTKSKANPSSSQSSKSTDPVEQDDDDMVIGDDMRTTERIPGPSDMEVDTRDGQIQVSEADVLSQEASKNSKNSLFPTPASPSDFKTAPSKPLSKPKSSSKPPSKSSSHSRTSSQTSASGHPGSKGRSKPPSAQTKTQKPESAKSQLSSNQSRKQANDMDVDEDQHMRPRSREEDRGIVPEQLVGPEPEVAESRTGNPPRPVTPENQIIRPSPPRGDRDTADFRTALHMPPSPADLFLPPLANAPVQVVAALTEEERAMTVEQWIRHEMAVQYQRLKEDGERRIRAFLEKAEETRRQIEAL